MYENLKSLFFALLFIFICNLIIDYLENNKKLDEDWRNSISVALIFLSVGYFFLVIFSAIV
jgi:ABC-type Mn2+/Zn2+ transport system permease subunit